MTELDDDLEPTLSGPGSFHCDLDGPAVVRGIVPATLREHMECPCAFTTSVVAINLETNALVACRAFPARDGMAPPPTDYYDPLPDEELDPGPGRVEHAFEVDVFEDLEIPRWPGTYNVHVLVRERRSEAFRIAVGFSDRMSDAAVTWYIGDQQRKIEALPVWPPARVPFPAYGERVELPVPELPGIVLDVPPVVPYAPGKRAVLRGAFRVPLQPQDRVRPSGEGGFIKRAIGPKAVVPINVVLAADDRVSLVPIPLAVPTSTLVDEGPQVFALGQFAVDLFEFEGMWREPQPVHIHAFSGGLSSAPRTIRILDESAVVARPRPKPLN